MTGFAIVFQSTFYHTACQVGAIGNAKIHPPATNRRMAVGGITYQKDPADAILGDAHFLTAAYTHRKGLIEPLFIPAARQDLWYDCDT